MVLGLDGSHGPHHLHRSVLEGIAMTMRGHVEAMESALGLAPGRLVVSGGGARSDLMTQLVADVFGRTAARPAVADAAGLGAAICAAVGHGTHPSFEAAVAAMTRPGDRFEPDPAAHARVRRPGRGLRRRPRRHRPGAAPARRAETWPD